MPQRKGMSLLSKELDDEFEAMYHHRHSGNRVDE
jgi:hypothetical protein